VAAGARGSAEAQGNAEGQGNAESQSNAESQGEAESEGKAEGRANVREAGAAMQQRQLPFTGSEVPLIVIAGATAIAAGALLRRRVDGAMRRS
jgi:hypothetical protein